MVNQMMALLPLAQMHGDGEAAGAVAFMMAFLGAMCVGLLIGVAIQVLICYFLSTFLKRLPPEYRQQQPNMVWLLLIPIFSLVWNFFVYPKISASYKAYLDAKGSTTHGDAGAGLALTFCILAACCIIPYLGVCAGVGALVVLIIYLVKINGYKDQIEGGSSNSTPPTPPVV